MRKHEPGQLHLLRDNDLVGEEIGGAFDPTRLTQARRLSGLTKKAIADQIGVSAVAVGQWESGTAKPRPDHIDSLAQVLDIPVSFLAIGRPYARLDAADAHFRSLRRTPARQRDKAIAFTEQIWELTYALEKRVRFPAVNLPGFAAGEVQQTEFPTDPVRAAQALRLHWGLGGGRIGRLARTMEMNGIIVTLAPFAGSETNSIDAFSTSKLPRPIVVLTPDRADDVYRHRFSAAHELGHLLLHGDCQPGDTQQEREADMFAAEFLTPTAEITPALPPRLDFKKLGDLSVQWGVSVDSLLRRCKEVGTVSEATYRRSYQRLAALRSSGLFMHEPVHGYPGEIPALLQSAFEMAEESGLTYKQLAAELRITLPRLRLLLGQGDTRPELELI